MERTEKKPVILWLSIPLAVLVILASITGLVTPGFYSAETPNWQAQSLGQDMVDLFLVVPCLLISALLAWQNRKGAVYIWAGVMTYLLYTFLIYCFAVRFNRLFIVYCLAMGMAFYSMLWFFFSQLNRPVPVEKFSKVPRRFMGIYFILVSVVFYFLWLSEIIPAILSKDVPKSVKDTGLVTNIVHVLDLAVFLPGIFMTGLFLLQKKQAGFIMLPVLLSFFVLMNITIGFLVVMLKQSGLEGSYLLAAVMGALAFLSLILLVIFVRRTGRA